jgi:adenylylsulfate kinase
MTLPPLPGFVIWFTGLPASGKTTLASAVQQRLAEGGVHCVLMDSDELRAVLTPQPSYTEAEREWFYGALIYLAAWLARNGVNVLVAATAHRRGYRKPAREQIERFAEVHVRCPLAVCRARDPKRLYARAAAGEVDDLPGLGACYEPPLEPEAVVDTDLLDPPTAAAQVLTQLAGLMQANPIFGG